MNSGDLSPPPPTAALLLELAADDNLAAFKSALLHHNLPLSSSAPWYGPTTAGRSLSLSDRTPAMIAALYNSSSVLSFILSSASDEALRRSPSDGATPLHLAALGSAPNAADILLKSSASAAQILDLNGLRPADVIPRRSPQTLGQLLRPSSPLNSKPSSPVKGDKREFGVDSTMPDIKEGIFGTDEFRMYQFKVKPCSRAYSHDWTECPFVHPGENARRRDPAKFTYSCVPCPEFKKGANCRNGDACEYAHGVFESWLHPAQYKTRLCKDEIGCNRRVCFFAHKPEEIRQVNPSAVSIGGGMMVSSPKASGLTSTGLSNLDMAAALMLMQQPQQAVSSSVSSGGWMNQSLHSPLQSQGNRLRTSLSARDMEFELESLGLENYRNKLIDEISANSPRLGWNSSPLTAASSRASEYSDLLGSVDPSMLNQLQGLSVKQQAGAQYQSPTGMRMNQQSQLLSGYGNSLSSSPPVSAAMSSQYGVDNSTAKAIMNSRMSAFAKRSQSFIDRGSVAGRQSTLSAMTSAAAAESSVLADWGSPNGKLDWGVQGEDLNKLRKSATFNFRNKQAPKTVASASPPIGFNEPDLSWVHSLVKETPQGQDVSMLNLSNQQMGFHTNGSSELHRREMMPLWLEHEKLMA